MKHLDIIKTREHKLFSSNNQGSKFHFGVLFGLAQNMDVLMRIPPIIVVSLATTTKLKIHHSVPNINGNCSKHINPKKTRHKKSLR